MFEFTITLPMFDVYKWFIPLLLKCELTVVHILFLGFNETFLPCFIIDDVNTMTIYFTTIKIKLEIREDIQCHEHLALIYRVINTTID